MKIIFLLLISSAGFAQVKTTMNDKDSSINIVWDTSHKYYPSWAVSSSPAEPVKFMMNDEAGTFLIWVKDSDTLQLIQPCKIKYIKIGKKVIKL